MLFIAQMVLGCPLICCFKQGVYLGAKYSGVKGWQRLVYSRRPKKWSDDYSSSEESSTGDDNDDDFERVN